MIDKSSWVPTDGFLKHHCLEYGQKMQFRALRMVFTSSSVKGFD
jgi:hypothetical protein